MILFSNGKKSSETDARIGAKIHMPSIFEFFKPALQRGHSEGLRDPILSLSIKVMLFSLQLGHLNIGIITLNRHAQTHGLSALSAASFSASIFQKSSFHVSNSLRLSGMINVSRISRMSLSLIFLFFI